MPKNEDVNRILIQNFVSLQKVLTDLVIKLDGLSDNIEKLLNLFETSAKSIAEKNPNFLNDNRDLTKKIDTLLEQNKTIARGITLMGEKDLSRVRRPMY